MCHPAARGVVPGAWLAVCGPDGRACIRAHANVRPRTSVPTATGRDAARAAVRRIRLFHPIRHSLIHP
ncbi:hypothetical protein DF160_06755 [Burkholderia anthina]|nr:hypothetical protein CFB35_25430 [Burkholderia sp. AU16482]RQV85305.1 hypothetical protein DF160_06755 [Burkholderia anthina]WJN74903.1 hypothetical protein OH687_31805 [Burkholderia anthina]